MATETFIIDYFFVSLAFRKCCDFLLKVRTWPGHHNILINANACSFLAAIYCDVHRSVANYLGIGLPRLRPAI